MASSNSPCAACKLQRRKCTPECIFAPYFPADQTQKFLNVHHVFCVSNVAKLLSEIEIPRRQAAVTSLTYEADARLRDPVYGCVGHVLFLKQMLRSVQDKITYTKNEIAMYKGRIALLRASQAAVQPPPQNLQHLRMGNSSTSAVAPQQYGMMVVPQAPVPNEPQAAEAAVQQLLARQEQKEELNKSFEQQQHRHQQLQQEPRLDNNFDGIRPSMAAPSGGNTQNPRQIGSSSSLGSSSVSPYLALGYHNQPRQNNENHPDHNQLQIVTVLQPHLSLQQHRFLAVQENQEQNQSLTEEHKDSSAVGFDVNIPNPR